MLYLLPLVLEQIIYQAEIAQEHEWGYFEQNAYSELYNRIRTHGLCKATVQVLAFFLPPFSPQQWSLLLIFALYCAETREL